MASEAACTQDRRDAKGKAAADSSEKGKKLIYRRAI